MFENGTAFRDSDNLISKNIKNETSGHLASQDDSSHSSKLDSPPKGKLNIDSGMDHKDKNEERDEQEDEVELISKPM